MTERTFTPPTEFPAEYGTEAGYGATILGRGEDWWVGFTHSDDDGRRPARPFTWSSAGLAYGSDDGRAEWADLHDIPPQPVEVEAWAVVYDDGSVRKVLLSNNKALQEAEHLGVHVVRLTGTYLP